MRRITAGACSAPYAGSGKLSDYRKDGSWIMNQMQKGYDKVERGIEVKDDGEGNVRFAKQAVAAAMDCGESWRVSRYVCPSSCQEDGVCLATVCLCLEGDIDGKSLGELDTLGGVLWNCLESDKSCFEKCHAWIGECSDVRVDFGCRCLCLCCDVRFQEESAGEFEDCLCGLGYIEDCAEC